MKSMDPTKGTTLRWKVRWVVGPLSHIQKQPHRLLMSNLSTVGPAQLLSEGLIINLQSLSVHNCSMGDVWGPSSVLSSYGLSLVALQTQELPWWSSKLAPCTEDKGEQASAE